MSTRPASTLYDVARAAGVSTATVSRVVHGQDRVRPSTRQRVLAVIEALGYVPDAAAQSMARQRTEVIGLVAVESRGPDTDIEQEGLLFIEEVLRGVELALSALGWSVLISVLRASDRPGAFQWLQKISAKVDGLLIAEGIVTRRRWRSWRRASRSCWSPARRTSRMPTSWTPTTGAAARPWPGIWSSSIGLTRMFYIAGPPEAPDAQERRSAFEDTVAGYPGAAITRYFEGRFAAVSGQLAVRELLAAPQRTLPDAIVCGNDQMALGAMRELQAAGIRVPADIAVVGFDDIHVGSLLTPALTTVRQPMRLLGERACSLLLERLADPSLPRQAERLPTELIIRESCGCPPVVPARRA